MRVAHGARVQLSGLTLSGPLPCASVAGVVVVQGSTLDVTDLRVRDMTTDDPGCTSSAGRAIAYGLRSAVRIDGVEGSTAYGHVSGVVVDTYETAGLYAAGPDGGPSTRVSFTDNVIDAGSPPVPVVQDGIAVFTTAVAAVSGNTVNGAACTYGFCGRDPINEVQSAGVLIAPQVSGTTVSDNTVTGAVVGIYQIFAPGCCSISGNTLVDSTFFGILIQDGDGTTRDNTITGGETGIGVAADAVDTTALLRGDRISGTTVAPVREFECCGFTATAVVRP